MMNLESDHREQQRIVLKALLLKTRSLICSDECLDKIIDTVEMVE